MSPGTFSVTSLVPLPVTAAVTVPEPEGVVGSRTEYSAGLLGKVVPVGAARLIALEPADMVALARRSEIT